MTQSAIWGLCVQDVGPEAFLRNSLYLFRGLPASEPLCVDPGSLRVRRFSRRSRTQTVVFRCVTAARGPPTREGWRTPLEKTDG